MPPDLVRRVQVSDYRSRHLLFAFAKDTAVKWVFAVLGVVADLERNLIVERVRAGLRHARAKGKRLGRPKKSVDATEVRSLRAAGESWRTIARKMDVSVGTVFAAAQSDQKPNPASSSMAPGG